MRITEEDEMYLTEYMKDKLNAKEMEMYAKSFLIYLKYDPVKDFVIDFESVVKWLGYSAKQKAKDKLVSKFKENIDYKILKAATPIGVADTITEITTESDTVINYKNQKNNGGHGLNKETILLTINCFKKFCMKANTSKADEIHDYYIKIESLSFGFKEKQDTKRQLKLIKQIKAQEKHDILLREFATSGPLVYIIKVKSLENGKYIVKIGESRRGISGRFNEHSGKYHECVILDCFSVARSRDFELFLHNHPKIKPSNYRHLENHTSENELFLVGEDLSYSAILDIIHQNKKFYEDHESLYLQVEYLKLEIERLSMIKSNPENQIYEELLKSNKELKSEIINMKTEIQELKKLTIRNSIKTTDNFETPISRIGDKLQKLNPETLELVDHYDTVAECMKIDKRIKRPSLNKAINNNTIYCGYRWLFVDKTQDASVVIKENIAPTLKTRPQHIGYIAKLNHDKSKIINVYLDRKTASRMNGYRSHGSLDNPVKFCKITNGNFYMLYNDCPDSLKLEFNESKPVILYKNGIGKFDKNNRLVEEFESKYNCIRDTEISEKSLNKALETQNSYNGFFYKKLGSKLSIK